MKHIEIPLSKTKVLLAFVGSLLFVLIGFYFFSIADRQTTFSPLLIQGVGLFSILFFGATGIYGFKKMFDKKIGLIIDDRGITDNTSAISIGLIEWTEITEIQKKQIMSTKFLLIFTKNPDKMMENVSGIQRKVMVANMNMCGTPFAITSTALQCNADDLEKLLTEALDKQRTTMSK